MNNTDIQRGKFYAVCVHGNPRNRLNYLNKAQVISKAKDYRGQNQIVVDLHGHLRNDEYVERNGDPLRRTVKPLNVWKEWGQHVADQKEKFREERERREAREREATLKKDKNSSAIDAITKVTGVELVEGSNLRYYLATNNLYLGWDKIIELAEALVGMGQGKLEERALDALDELDF